MGEAMLACRGGIKEDSNTPKLKWKLYTELITYNTQYVIPTCKNQELTVMAFGGGGGYYAGNGFGGGGGGGYMEKNVVSIAAGQVVPITIGDGGTNNNSGGTTSFGTYIAANGGERANYGNGGNGGAGGGGSQGNGGSGSNFGGGGPGLTGLGFSNGGSGGKYGGQGGMAYSIWSGRFGSVNNFINQQQYQPIGYGGSGGFVTYADPNNTKNNNAVALFTVIMPTDGTNISNFDNELFELPNIAAICGNSQIMYGNYSNGMISAGFGGGGGYGGRGGNGSAVEPGTSGIFPASGGGGGGYGCNGGDGYAYKTNRDDTSSGGGGGGGYGSDGDDGYKFSDYYAYGGGGGGYGPSGYGHGGTRFVREAKSGCVVISYYGLAYE